MGNQWLIRGRKEATPRFLTRSGQILATSHEFLGPQKVAEEGKSPYFKSRLVKYENLGRPHLTHSIHVWHIYLHLVDFSGKCTEYTIRGWYGLGLI